MTAPRRELKIIQRLGRRRAVRLGQTVERDLVGRRLHGPLLPE
jgi:hypothetical protein